MGQRTTKQNLCERSSVAARRGRENRSLTDPNTRLLEVAESASDGLDAVRVRSSTHLAEETLKIVLLQPLGGIGNTFCPNSTGDAHRRGAGAVGVEVLVHL